jgi:hypothetical protein
VVVVAYSCVLNSCCVSLLFRIGQVDVTVIGRDNTNSYNGNICSIDGSICKYALQGWFNASSDPAKGCRRPKKRQEDCSQLNSVVGNNCGPYVAGTQSYVLLDDG